MFKKTKNFHKYGACFLKFTKNPPRAEFIKAYTFKSQNAEKARKTIKGKESADLELSIIRLGGEFDAWVARHKKEGRKITHLGVM